MNLKTRRIIYISFFIIFFLLSALIVLYTAGYYYHFKKDKFQKSGGILLEFRPKEIDVYIQGKKRSTTGFFENSFKAANLLPGEYDISLTKKGYHPWQKKLTVESEKINFIKNIVLFKANSKPNLIFEGPMEGAVPFPKKEKIFFIEKMDDLINLKIYDEISGETVNIAPLKTTSTAAIIPKFSFNEKRLSFNFNKKNYLFNLGKDELIILEKKLPQLSAIKTVQWSQTSDDAVYILNDNEIYQLNLRDYALDKLISKKSGENISIRDFSVIGNKVYLIYSGESSSFLEERGKDGKDPILLRSNISQNFKFIASPRPYITLLDKDSENLMVINVTNREIIFQDSANEIFWSNKLSDDNYKIAYNNDFEIYTYDINANEKILINRHSKIVDKISWYPDYNHLTFAYNNSINITDIDKNNKKSWHTLLNAGQIKNIITSYDGKKIYFEGSIDDKSGLFEFEIL